MWKPISNPERKTVKPIRVCGLAEFVMSQDTVDIPLREHARAVPPHPHPKSKSRLIKIIAALVIVVSVAGSAAVSRHIEHRLFFSRVALVGIALELAILAFLCRHRVAQILKEFFTATAHPLNLAIFRIAVFWAIFHEVQLSEIGFFSRMPSGLQFAPWGMGMLLPHLPIRARLAAAAAKLLLASSAAGFVGIFSRTSALACALLGFYALGIPQFYGKVDHNQHLLWFALILATSPCGDFFSLDAVIGAWKRAGRGITDPLPPSQVYALPLRFVMLLIGAIYFFPGFWKLWQSGFDWFLTDNLRQQLYLFWTWSFDGSWLPAFRIDQHVLFCRIVAAATPLFELSFIFFMFHRTLRAVAALDGLVFHAATNRLMRISFLSLRVCYVAFFDWAGIFAYIGRALYREEVFFVYDGNNASLRRLVGFAWVWDVFRRIIYIDSADKEARSRLPLRLPESDERLIAQKTLAAVHNKIWTGPAAYRALAWRIPILWPIAPLLYFWPHSNRVPAVHKGPAAPQPVSTYALPPIAGGRVQLGCIAVVGSLLLLGTVCGGVSRHINGWPFACYPTFSLPPPTQIASLGIVAVAPSGEEAAVRNFGFPYHRYYGLSRNILAIKDPLLRNDRLLLVWARAVRVTPELRTSVAVKFYVENLRIDPALWSRNPENRTLLFVWHPPADGSIPQRHSNVHLLATEWQ